MKRREEQAKYGVYFDDDYDYLQHLREVNEVVRLEPVEDRFRISSRNLERTTETAEEEETVKVSGVLMLIYAFQLSAFQKPELRLPASLFECPDVELKVGLLNQAAPAPGKV